MPASVLLTPPVSEPIALDEAKAHLRVDHDLDDDLITLLIAAARDYCENCTGRALVTQQWRLWLDAPPSPCAPIPLPFAPVAHIDAVTFHLADNALVTLDPAQYALDEGTPALRFANDAVRPANLRSWQALAIDYTAGYGDNGASVPAALRQGMLAHIAFAYENRGDMAAGVAAAPELALAYYNGFRRLRVGA